MKLLLLFIPLLLLFNVSCSQTEKQNESSTKNNIVITDKQTLISTVFSCLQSNDAKRYKTLTPKSWIFDTYTEDFEKAYNRGIELKINWPETILDSIKFDDIDSNSYKGQKTFSGKIFFHQNSSFYKINFKDLLDNGKNVCIQTLFVPYEDVRTKNIILTADLKNEYVTGCTAEIESMISEHPFVKSSFGDCIRCYCEAKYYDQIQFDDGVERIKKKEYDIRVKVTKTNQK